MVSTGCPQRLEGQHYTSASTSGVSIASKQAALYANTRSLTPRNIPTSYPASSPSPGDDDRGPMNARSSNHDSPSAGRGGRRRPDELESRDSDYETAPDRDGYSSGDWSDDTSTLGDDVEMVDGTVPSGSRNPLLSGPTNGQRYPYAERYESVTTTPGRNFTPYARWGPSEAGTSTSFNPVHGHGAGTSARNSPTPRYNTRESAKMCIVSTTFKLDAVTDRLCPLGLQRKTDLQGTQREDSLRNVRLDVRCKVEGRSRPGANLLATLILP